MATIEKQMKVQHDATVPFRAEMRSEFAALAPIISLQFYRRLALLSERLAVVEKKA